MPKALSLKKSKQAGPPKNQNPITQFFKNKPNGTSEAVRNHEIPSQKTLPQRDERVSNKRKAASPELVDLCEFDGDILSDIPSSLENNQKINKANKKAKIEEVTLQSTPTKNRLTCKILKSPEKENCVKLRKPLNIGENEKQISELLNCEKNDFDGDHVQQQAAKRNITPKKNLITELRRSPRIAKLLTPEKLKESSPIKKALDFGQEDGFGDFVDEWELNDIEEETVEDLDLTVMQRCEVLNVIRHPTSLELKLKNTNNNRGTCFVEGFWLDTPISEREILSILASRDDSGKFSVSNTAGLIVLRPDHLVSSTSVVAGVFCKRKAVLQERWRGIDSANSAMTIGTLIHELVQKALTQNIQNIQQLSKEADRIIKESIQLLYDAGLSEDEVRTDMQAYIQPLAEFMQTYLAKKPPSSAPQNKKGKWNGHVNKVLDIEENLCCPELGLKGKIDATLEVTIHDRKGTKLQTVPLELKSGKASESAEHRGQLVLYGMMLALQRGQNPALAEQRGLLLYLKNSVELREVSCGYPERRDLVLLRNKLVKNLAAGPEDVDPEQIMDIEDASALLQQRLPGPIHRENVCSKCPYLTLCSLHLWHTDGRSVSETHPLSKLREPALGHLSEAHIKYFLHWTALLKIEERGQMGASPLHALWTDSVEKREKRGTCAANLHLKSVEESGDRYLHVFLRKMERSSNSDKSVESKGPQEGEFSIVSIDKRPWIAAGVVLLSKENEMHILLERDLSQRLPKSTKFHIDTYESYATTVQNLTNLGVLMEDSERAQRLRSIIIDKETPLFEKKQPREVGRLGSKMMRGLNIEQQRAVLRALAATHYALLRGLPGTGKTQTLSVLIQMAVALKMRILVTAHTHSAVDNLLARLPKTIRIMRLGPKSRVAASMSHCCEQELAAKCDTPEQLEKLYDSMEVVGVTCLGASHAMLSRTTFDMCIVDEATQVLQSTVLRPLFAAKRFVLVGDPDQLPPVVRSRAARRLGMEESLFHRLMNEEATSTLALQYRMNSRLAELANRVAYAGRLACASDTVARACLHVDLEKISESFGAWPWLAEACSPEGAKAAIFLDVQTAAGGRSLANTDEACMVLALVNTLLKGGVKPGDIGVIAPYREQVSLLRRTVGGLGVEASTVDQFQGRDKSVILYSCTRRCQKQDDREVKEGEVLNDNRRLAVSVTRAKHKLIVIGDSRALRRYAPLTRMIDACATVQIPASDIKQVIDEYGTSVA
ncbi:hypothetical protein ABMA27_008447 [Loxostege sticticalis]|uniref:DNA helicase n=1 Tax=Loxostege sticticalis TaxID=481309 RepID=A0ABR3HBB9_LOXSC